MPTSLLVKIGAAGLPLLAAATLVPAVAGSLKHDLGRNDVRVHSAAYRVPSGRTVAETALAERLESLGYRRRHDRPQRPGEFFWGHEVFRIYQREHRRDGRLRKAKRLGLRLRKRDGMILGPLPADAAMPVLEPELLAESLDGDRAQRRPVRFDDLPTHVWRAVLAAEDARFFDHAGVDGRALARALLANVKAGGAVQGGSTITQQLIKNRDLSPRKTLRRKASEALRALALEAEYDKREILESYLDSVYLGHVDGLAVHGFGAAAEVWFSRPAEQLELPQAALLAGMIQGPNRLNPRRHPDRAVRRRNWVLDRMAELKWVSTDRANRARRSALGLAATPPRPPAAPHFLDWVAAIAAEAAPRRIESGRGVVIETTLDPHLQRIAEGAVRDQLAALRRVHRRLRTVDLSAALVALDARSGAVLAYVGGDPNETSDRFDRVRRARRQPGSAVKPLLLLEAFEECGGREPLHPATRVADEPLRVELPRGVWEPDNFDDRYHGVVDLRTATRQSYNVPFARVANWCDPSAVAARMRRAGLPLPDRPPPSFSLGAVEATPLELARAYSVLPAMGRSYEPYGVRLIERPGGRDLRRFRPRSRRVVGRATAYLVRDLLVDAVERGTGRAARIDGVQVAGKTGTSSSARDAWFVGDAGGIVAAVWVGLDRDGNLGLTGGQAAAPLWKRFVQRAVGSLPVVESRRPREVVVRRVNPQTGLLVDKGSRRGRDELFRRSATPRRDRFWRRDRAEAVLR